MANTPQGGSSVGSEGVSAFIRFNLYVSVGSGGPLKPRGQSKKPPLLPRYLLALVPLDLKRLPPRVTSWAHPLTGRSRNEWCHSTPVGRR